MRNCGLLAELTSSQVSLYNVQGLDGTPHALPKGHKSIRVACCFEMYPYQRTSYVGISPHLDWWCRPCTDGFRMTDLASARGRIKAYLSISTMGGMPAMLPRWLPPPATGVRPPPQTF